MSGQQKKQQAGLRIARRDFLGYAVKGGAMVVASAALSGFTGGCRLSISPKPGRFALEELTISELQDKMRSGEFSARSLAEMYLARIRDFDKRGPGVNSIIEINPDALPMADSLDRERRRNRVRGPLHGIPVLVKDNIATADRMKTTAGSLALLNSKALRDAFVAERLRQAGAILLGKTNLSEWANFRSTRSSSGWSARGGQTRNPYALDRSPGGSSSGSAAAVAANFCAAAIGTETNGSIINPSAANSIVGIKPTVGLVSRSGIIPISHSQDTAGPMARTVADAAVLLGALTGVDPRDDATRMSSGKAHSDYTQFLDPNGLRGARIGVARNYFGSHERVDALMNDAIEVMKQHGAILIDPANVGSRRGLGSSENEVLHHEFKADLNKYLAELGSHTPVHSLKEIIQFNEANKEKEMPYFGQEIFLKAEEKGSLESEAYLKALNECRRLSRDEGIDATLRKDRLDAIMAPSGGAPCVIDLINGDHFLGGSSSAAAVAGYPNITVPAGYICGLPVGISFFAGAFSEPTLIKLAYAFEQATHFRRPPRFPASADLGA
jgi:amidase